VSRVARNPIPIPPGVEVRVLSDRVSAKGPKGELHCVLHSLVSISKDGDSLTVGTRSEVNDARVMAGTTRALVNNLVTGVSVGFEKRLTIIGVGYRAQVQGKNLNLALGYSHPVNHPIPDGITVETPTQTEIVVKGADKQVVGQTAAEIRSYRPPEPYKGKGVRYSDERVVRKQAKKK